MATDSTVRHVPRHEYDVVVQQLAAANAQVEALTKEIGRLAELVAKGNEQFTELTAIAQRKKRGKRKSPPKPPDPPPSLDDDGRAAFADRPAAPKLPPKKKQKPTGRKPVPEHLEAEEHTLRPDTCGKCGGRNLKGVDVVVETKLHTVKEHQRRRVVRRET